MDRRSRTWLTDIAVFGSRILATSAGRTAADYVMDNDLRDIVERNLLKIGEMIVRLRDHDGETVSQLEGFRGVIGLRNTISHDYKSLSDEEIWELVQRALPVLLKDVGRVLDADDRSASERGG